MEGVDHLLLSPGREVEAAQDDVRLSGEIVFARRWTDGRLRLAVLGGGSAAADGWRAASDGCVAVDFTDAAVSGLSRGPEQVVAITMPAGVAVTALEMDGQPMTAVLDGDKLTVRLPAGTHAFEGTVRRE
jgi:hypothetical protein